MRKSTDEIREAFLDFFHGNGHHVIASSSLVPKNDPTLLFTNAGMNQFKNTFLGIDNRNYTRATSAQRCVRAGGKHNDIENIGYTARHHTFFEMLGNFSFGDYFKQQAIHYAWELLTSKNWFNLQKDRIWVTVYEADDESYKIWGKEIGIPNDRIIRIGDNKGAPHASDNFWQMGDTGPCGPCTEIFYDLGDQIPGSPPGSMEEFGDRYIEIWNIVFMQFNRQSDGCMKPLPKPSVDTGMGLERIASVLQNVNSNYEIDLFRTLIETIAKITGTTDLNNKSLRVIADHIRSCVFLISDGVIPSNEWRGYVLRRSIRRSIRHGNILGVKDTFLYKIVKSVINVMGSIGKDLKSNQTKIEQVIKTEEEQFSKTLGRGLSLLEEKLIKLEGDTLDGRTAFLLYDTYGIPLDLTEDVCHERNIKINTSDFKIAMEDQRRRSRSSSGFNSNYNTMIYVHNTTTQFEGYNHVKIDNAKVIRLINGEKSVEHINIGQDALVILDKTPFYAESGGQVGDTGDLKGRNFCFLVKNTKKYGQAIGHLGNLSFGSLKVGDIVQAQINQDRRRCIQLNHTATHLMHSALRMILDNRILQKGSLITDKMLRFDFSHFKAMRRSEIRTVESLVNMQIRRNLSVKTTIMDLSTAIEKGAIALFSEKYDEHVRVLSIGDFSTELCAGTHVTRTGDIGLFRIISESGSSFGVRRIEAITGEAAMESLHAQSDRLHEISQLLKGDSQNIFEKVHSILKRNLQLEKEVRQLKEKIALKKIQNLFSNVIDVSGVKLLVSEITEIESNILRTIVSNIKNQLGSTIIVLATIINDKVYLIVGVSKDLSDRVRAWELISILAKQVGGKGGGRSEIAQATGTDIQELSKALASVKDWVIDKLQ